MTTEEQYRWIDEREFRMDAHAELRLRDVAREIVDSKAPMIGTEVRVPARGRLRHYEDDGFGRPFSSPYHEIRVDVSVLAGVDRDIALLLVEKLIRPQLIEAGWRLLPKEES